MTAGLSRRSLLGAAGVLALDAQFARSDEAPRVKLRLLSTTDLHMFVMDWDYYHARIDPKVGLVKIAALVAQARRENPNCLLFDNGDLLQGDPLADWCAAPGRLPEGALHPMFEVMNGLRYDAATLGNHEFNYGLAFLERALNGPKFPYVSTNILRTGGAPFLPPTAVLERTLVDASGAPRQLKIGVIGFAPPQIMSWDKSRVEGRIEVGDAVEAARRHLPGLRESCDVVVALLHGGIDFSAHDPGQENPALALCQLPGLDALVLGHQHKLFPGPAFAGHAEVDALAGKIGGVPAVMPGFWGSHLGVIDLDLVRDHDRWRVAGSQVEARPISRRDGESVAALVEADPATVAAIAPAHRATVAWMDQPVGHFAMPVDSYFCWAGYDPATALVNEAQLDYGRRWLAGTPYADLPLLSAMAPNKSGYTPDSYVDIAAGPVALRDAADLYVYANTVVALKVTGAQIRDWLEYAARAFLTLTLDAAGPQELVDRRIPGYNFDAIAGLTYRIDPTRPPAFERDGERVAGGGRIFDLRYQGEVVPPERAFMVITNSYRADSGKTPGANAAALALRAPDANRDAVIDYIRARKNKNIGAPAPAPWRFVDLPKKIAAAFDTGVGAREKIGEVPGLRLIREAEAGYLRVGFDLG
ncbi:2',3'-cyclic-nucleotide 2'-phosphodiesterase / 3'-nucleotidase [Rhodoblastus acidophilus]|uniref:2',3'-cyclic-nucleotide 2'-phosphodiesterase / 3'-nucleotidase n=1 Tax=Rhodoblastus acidophilus TaxID=1074 RepID=A0A212PZ94_RHOAC|nr:bifunctional 2',3'-cyclic-nucleotide 2'-phosphodiesterase/3'-nucleotidase [Rhodoblastus acidophilus]PPQ38686.1 bifunctional 2',3'-cyclic-nucleotide 2'-phosphodiesterase/3'-nucleotidase [Rhodoblastus acidophilus]RAI17817.1 2',3'-cyclic-nucleotide 2'-phosphodiesterase [Rhodoblastus acidophilus]SNB52340.1 2',3'-cyclic-nucleotide 2'-phosphodiesterase / 3'-nucleotidase [Rhodoblastus acidophilus]